MLIKLTGENIETMIVMDYGHNHIHICGVVGKDRGKGTSRKRVYSFR